MIIAKTTTDDIEHKLNITVGGKITASYASYHFYESWKDSTVYQLTCGDARKAVITLQKFIERSEAAHEQKLT